MSFTSFTPMSDEELEAQNAPLTLGDCDFIVTECIERPSSNGNPMKEISLSVTDANGVTKDIKDNLVLTPKAMWKIKEFCAAIGKLQLYKNGCIPDQALLNACGRANIVAETYINKNGEERKALKVGKYIEKKAEEPTPLTADMDDDIPF